MGALRHLRLRSPTWKLKRPRKTDRRGDQYSAAKLFAIRSEADWRLRLKARQAAKKRSTTRRPPVDSTRGYAWPDAPGGAGATSSSEPRPCFLPAMTHRSRRQCLASQEALGERHVDFAVGSTLPDVVNKNAGACKMRGPSS